MKRSWALPGLLVAAAVAVLLIATRRDLNEPHIRLFSDMVRTPAYVSQGENPIFRNGETQQVPPPGTLSRDAQPLHYGNTPEERERAGKELKNPFPPSFEVTARGKQAFERYCSHCHGFKGLGDGAVAKAFPQFSFPVASKSTYDLPDGTLFHIITYGRNLMPSHASQLPQDDRWKIIHYLRDLQRDEIARLGPEAVIPEDTRRRTLVSEPYGKELFATNCASCHGEEGRRPNPGIPTLNSPSVLAIADDAYYWDIINHGRSGTQMPAWRSVLTKTQLQSILMHIRSWAGPEPERGRVARAGSDAEKGRALFTTHCVGCHGPQGEGGIGNSLSAPSFLAIASDQFLRDTISLGRGHTAMPASYDLKAEDVGALLAYIRSWQKSAPAYEDVAAAAATADPKAGKTIFDGKCAACHGSQGEGGIGSRLNSDSFLSMADNRFLYNVITQGRPGTGMPSWRTLGANDLANVISYVRAWQKSPAVVLGTNKHSGRAEFGELLFQQRCVECHGPQGAGAVGTQIANPALLAQVPDEFIWRTVAYGKDGTEMKGFFNRATDPLGTQDIDHIIAYLRRSQSNPPVESLKRPGDPFADTAVGREVYENKGGCMQCHGAHGEGGAGPSLGNPGFLKAASDGFLAGTIVLGREGTGMLSFFNGDGPQLDAKDIENVVAYMRGFEQAPPKTGRQVDRAPERVASGRTVFGQNCVRCHGAAGEGKHGDKPGDFGPSLNTPEFLKAADDNFLLATIAMGRPGTPMPAFGDGMGGKKGLDADQIRDVVSFLRSWEKRK